MHSGVSAALEQLGKYAAAGKDGHILITSVDGGPNGIDAVKEGYIDAMAEQSLLVMGSEALETVLKAIDGEEVEKLIQLAPVSVTSENADSEELWPNKIKK
jgi:ABC-type sugar transport system substrate-binding protein